MTTHEPLLADTPRPRNLGRDHLPDPRHRRRSASTAALGTGRRVIAAICQSSSSPPRLDGFRWRGRAGMATRGQVRHRAASYCPESLDTARTTWPQAYSTSSSTADALYFVATVPPRMYAAIQHAPNLHQLQPKQAAGIRDRPLRLALPPPARDATSPAWPSTSRSMHRYARTIIGLRRDPVLSAAGCSTSLARRRRHGALVASTRHRLLRPTHGLHRYNGAAVPGTVTASTTTLSERQVLRQGTQTVRQADAAARAQQWRTCLEPVDVQRHELPPRMSSIALSVTAVSAPAFTEDHRSRDVLLDHSDGRSHDHPPHPPHLAASPTQPERPPQLAGTTPRIPNRLNEARWAIRAATNRTIHPLPKGDALTQYIVTLHWRIPDRRIRDADGMATTYKACADALVQEGILTDDSWRYVPEMRLPNPPTDHRTSRRDVANPHRNHSPGD